MQRPSRPNHRWITTGGNHFFVERMLGFFELTNNPLVPQSLSSKVLNSTVFQILLPSEAIHASSFDDLLSAACCLQSPQAKAKLGAWTCEVPRSGV